MEYPLVFILGLIGLTLAGFCFDSYSIRKNKADYSEEYRMFCLFLQTNPDKFSRTVILESINKAKIYSLKYGHLPKSKRPELMNILKDYE